MVVHHADGPNTVGVRDIYGVLPRLRIDFVVPAMPRLRVKS